MIYKVKTKCGDRSRFKWFSITLKGTPSRIHLPVFGEKEELFHDIKEKEIYCKNIIFQVDSLGEVYREIANSSRHRSEPNENYLIKLSGRTTHVGDYFSLGSCNTSFNLKFPCYITDYEFIT